MSFFHLSDLLQMPNHHRIVDTEILGKFSFSVKGSASVIPSISCQILMAGHCTLHRQGSCLLCKTSLTTTALYFCYQFLVTCVVGVASCLCFTTHFEFE